MLQKLLFLTENLTESEFIEIETYLLEKYGVDEHKQCKLPDSYTGYEVANCDVSASDELKLSTANCLLSCSAGYSPIAGYAPKCHM